MRHWFLLTIFFGFALLCCKKTADDRPRSKTDYVPIISAFTPRNVILGEQIRSRVRMGFYSYNADVTFLNFEVKETAARQYAVRAKGFYDNINYEISLPVLMMFDSTLSVKPAMAGQYLIKFYSSSNLVQTDTVQVN